MLLPLLYGLKIDTLGGKYPPFLCVLMFRFLLFPLLFVLAMPLFAQEKPKDTAFINGQAVKLDVPAMIESDRTLVPLRFVAEALGCDVEWKPEIRRILITL